MEIWKKCSSCKKPIAFGADYWACNVSTCNRPRTFLVFCSVSCWDAHLAIVRHRETWAEEKKAPTPEFWAKVESGEEIFPPRPPREKAEEKPAVKPSSGPKVILRRQN